MSIDSQVHEQQRYVPLSICSIKFCPYIYREIHELEAHERLVHPDLPRCGQCSAIADSNRELETHARETDHFAFACKEDECNSKFFEVGVYRRHVRKHQDDAVRFPCRYCRKYRGKEGFKRKDHLTQHIRNYHHIGEDEVKRRKHYRPWCSKQGCNMSQSVWAGDSKSTAFASSTEWIKHMRTVHDESIFPCLHPGCDRIDGKGYFREADIRTHVHKVHGTDTMVVCGEYDGLVD